MDKEKLKLRDERILRIYFTDGDSLVDVNNSDIWEKILNQKNRIIKIESNEWTWYTSTGEVIFH